MTSSYLVSGLHRNYGGVPGLLLQDLVIFSFRFFLFQSDRPTQYQETHSTLYEKKGNGLRILLSSAESKLYICTYNLDQKIPLAPWVTRYTLNKYVNIYSLYVKTKQQHQQLHQHKSFVCIRTRTSGLHSNVSIFHNVNSSNAMPTTSARNSKVYVTTKKH